MRAAAAQRPDFSLESEHSGTVCGVDEAGRGPLAGPVVAAAAILERNRPLPEGLNDSKKLTARRREYLYAWLRENAAHAVAVVSAEEIDRHNILRATLRAMTQAVEALNPAPSVALVDGNAAPPLTVCQARTVVKGDSRSLSIAAASILAKVTRDRMMQRLAEDYPHYGFERHMGYGTAEHLEALRRHGPCPAHRRSFAPVRNLLPEDAS